MRFRHTDHASQLDRAGKRFTRHLIDCQRFFKRGPIGGRQFVAEVAKSQPIPAV